MTVSPVSGEKLKCPICGQVVAPGQFAAGSDIEPVAVNFIREKVAGWTHDKGLCPTCLQGTLDALAEEAGSDVFTSNGQPLFGILPVGVRLGYNPEYNGSGTTLAFIDSGFYPHPDLEGRIKLYVDASNSEIRESGRVEEAGALSWHGMMTSVVACGDGSRSGGLYRGLASGAELVLIRVSDPEGRVNEETIGRGLAWLLGNARRFGVQIVNISVGGDKPPESGNNPVDLMVEALAAQGILTVCAAGNGGERKLVPPASAPGAITVGGIDDKNTPDPYAYDLWHSNYGQTRAGLWKPEVVAPSLWLAAPVLPGSEVAQQASALEQILKAPVAGLPALLSDIKLLSASKLPDEAASLPPEEIRELALQNWRSQKLISPHYQHVDGTSFAAPIVSSVAAQMLQANPGLTPPGLKDLILRTARYLPEVPPYQQGHGVVDPWPAVAAALATTGY